MKRFFSLLMVAVMLFVFPSCGAKKDETADKTIQYYMGQEPQTLDPQVATDESAKLVIGAIYEGLARLDESGKAVPGVAQSWTANGSYTTFTFQLRQDAAWTDEKPVTASDFVFAFRRALNPQTQSAACRPLYVIKNARRVNSGAMPAEQLGVRAQGEKTLVVDLEYSYAEFPALTASSVFMPCREDYFQSTHGKYGLEYQYVLSNGPFLMGGKYSWDHGKSLKLTRSDTYKGEKPAKPAVLMLNMSGSEVDVSNPLQALKDSKVDVIALPEQQVEQAKQLEYSITSFQDITWGLVFQTKDPLMQNEKIRQGLLAALPREKLLQHVPEQGQAADAIIGPQASLMGKNYRQQSNGVPGYFQPSAQSKALLQAGLKELGLQAFDKVTVVCPDNENAKRMVNEMLVVWNQQTGQYFSMLPLSESELNKAVQSGEYQIAVTGIHPEKDGKLLSVFRSDNPENPAHLNSKELDQLLLTAEQSDTVGALSAYQQAENYLNHHGIFYPIYYKNSYYACGEGVSGIVFRPNSAGIDFMQAGKLE